MIIQQLNQTTFWQTICPKMGLGKNESAQIFCFLILKVSKHTWLF